MLKSAWLEDGNYYSLELTLFNHKKAIRTKVDRPLSKPSIFKRLQMIFTLTHYLIKIKPH